jgi:hypothetical protein
VTMRFLLGALPTGPARPSSDARPRLMMDRRRHAPTLELASTTVGRVVRHAEDRPRLAFNVPSTFSKWWENPDWIDLFGHDVAYGDADERLPSDSPPPGLADPVGD